MRNLVEKQIQTSVPTLTFPRLLVVYASLVPVDDVIEFPRILAKLEFELPLFVDDQLSRGVEHASSLVFVRVIYLDLACSQVVSYALGIVIMFTESKLTVGDEANLAAGFGWDQANIAQVVPYCAGYGNTTHGLHLGKGIY